MADDYIPTEPLEQEPTPLFHVGSQVEQKEPLERVGPTS
jgi:hypothetical protein